MRAQLGILFTIFVGFSACSHEDVESRRSQPSQSPQPDELGDGEPGLELTQSECNVAANLSKVTASPSGSLFINSPDVLNDARAKVVNGVPGKWSFPYAIREILELPNPSNNPTLLAAEQTKVNEFLNKYTQTGAVNGFSPPSRASTRQQLAAAWGKTRGSDGKDYLTFDKAPFKLVAIVNRLDLVKKGQTDVTAGEGRFVYGFTGVGAMTVIFEYDLAIGTASNKGMATILDWARKWQGLKSFLQDTDAAVAGTQPNQTIGAALAFRDKAGYLSALEGITELWASRSAQHRTGGTQASIAQIRTNEILSSPWELRELIRWRNSAGKASLALTTVKNNPDKSFANGGNGLASWLASNVTCSNAADKNTCSYNTPNAQLPARIAKGNKTVGLLGATALEDFTWFPRSTDVKQRFAALNTCSGCHTGETNTAFVHVDSFTGAPSTFLENDLVARLRSFKNLVCLATAGSDGLNLADAPANIEALRIDTSRRTH